MTLVAFCVGNILGTQTFQHTEAPGYDSGKISIMATLSVLCVVIVCLRLSNDRLNRKKEREVRARGDQERDELREKMAFADQTDQQTPCFRYTH